MKKLIPAACKKLTSRMSAQNHHEKVRSRERKSVRSLEDRNAIKLKKIAAFR
jgi:hypothetical protein